MDKMFKDSSGSTRINKCSKNIEREPVKIVVKQQKCVK